MLCIKYKGRVKGLIPLTQLTSNLLSRNLISSLTFPPDGIPGGKGVWGVLF
jgi:hypothetical protein